MTANDELRREIERPWKVLKDASGARGSDLRGWIAELLEDLARAERRVRDDYGNRYPIELLQNAHDAAAEAGTPGRVWVVVTETALLVANEGVPFTVERLRALIRLGASSKREGFKRHVIGYKGIGFSSVHAISDTPQIHSAGITFGFDKRIAAEAIEHYLGRPIKPVPIRAFPRPTSLEEWGADRELAEELVRQGAVTVIRLPFRTGVSAADVWTNIERTLTKETLLFLPNTEEVALEGPDHRDRWRRRAGRSFGAGRVVHLESKAGSEAWLIASATVPAPRGATTALDDEIWRQVMHLNVAAALPWAGRTIDADRAAQPLYVYFPTEDRLGRSLLLHGDFYVASSRRHIQSEGPGGDISRAVAEGAADLAARLAESVAGRDGLTQVLGPRAKAQGYGAHLSELLDERLKRRRIVRAAAGERLRRASELRIFDPDMGDSDDDAALLALVRDKSELVNPRDAIGPGKKLLEALGASPLRPDEIAERLGHPPRKADYERSLEVLQRWLTQLPGWQRNWALERIRRAPILLDQDGRWRAPANLMVEPEGVPLPPPSIRRGVARIPEDPWVRSFVTRDLEVTVLQPEDALNDVIEALRAGRYGRRPEQRKALLRWLLDFHASFPDVVRAAQDDLVDLIQVPVRTNSSGGHEHWSVASEAYVLPPTERPDGSQVDRPWLALLYRSLDEVPFVATDAIPGFDHSPRHYQMLRDLGVAATPRIRKHTIEVAPYEDPPDAGLAHVAEWLQTEAVQAAMECPSGPRVHGTARRRIETPCLDRLDELLDRRDRQRLTALAVFIAQERQEMIESAKVRCLGITGHPESKATSYQTWRLTESDWVPTTEPDGTKGYRRPIRAWFGLPRSLPLLLSRTDLPSDEIAEAIGCSSGLKPSRRSLETALVHLWSRHRETAADSRVADTARWLMDRLDSLEDPPERIEGGGGRVRLRFLALRGGVEVWETDPVVPDLPHVERLTTLTILPPDRRWDGLARDYGLRRASSVVTWRVIAEPGSGEPRLFDRRAKVELLALLSRGSDKRQVARRLARLQERRVRTVRLRLEHGDEEVHTEPLPYHLEITRSDDGEVTRADLLIEGAYEPSVLLCHEVARYLGNERRGHMMHSYFTSRTEVLAMHGVDPQALAEAEEALERFSADEPPAERIVFDDWASIQDEEWSPTEAEAPHRPPADRPITSHVGTSFKGTSEEPVARRIARPEVTTAAKSEAPPRHRPPEEAGMTRDLRTAGADGERASATAKTHSDRPPESGRQRLRSYVHPDLAGGIEHDPVAPDGSDVDRAGIERVLAFERAHGRQPEEQHHANPGFDVRSVDPATGEVRYIEVKSLSGNWDLLGVGLTKRQYEMARKERSAFWLYVVERARSRDYRIHRIQDPASQVDEYRLDDGWRYVAEGTEGGPPTPTESRREANLDPR